MRILPPPTAKRSTTSLRAAVATCNSTTPISPTSATLRFAPRTQSRGDDPDALVHLYCKLVNDSIRDRPSEMVVSAHLCRGNFKSAWVAQGGYEPVAEILLNEMKIDGFFLEYDDERSGDFAPLRFTPKGVTIVLGLMSSKHAAAEAKDEIKRRIDEACALRSARAVRAQSPVRLLLDRTRQRFERGRSVDQASALRRGRNRGLGRGVKLRRHP